jgi:DMSO/TMAO reductase YedYZ molybdopterin-dependent catalytic subunit
MRFDDPLRTYPAMSLAKWARVESSVNLDASGNPNPYFMSLDLATARHPQTLLATHFNGEPLTVDHGAPLRLLVPVKLGLKNVKAITRITHVAEEPRDDWAERGYSRTTEFSASSLSMQQLSVRRGDRFSTTSSHPAHFLRRTQCGLPRTFYP